MYDKSIPPEGLGQPLNFAQALLNQIDRIGSSKFQAARDAQIMVLKNLLSHEWDKEFEDELVRIKEAHDRAVGLSNRVFRGKTDKDSISLLNTRLASLNSQAIADVQINCMKLMARKGLLGKKKEDYIEDEEPAISGDTEPTQ